MSKKESTTKAAILDLSKNASFSYKQTYFQTFLKKGSQKKDIAWRTHVHRRVEDKKRLADCRLRKEEAMAPFSS